MDMMRKLWAWLGAIVLGGVLLYMLCHQLLYRF